MALNNFIPEVWSARLLQALEKSLVFASPMVVNRDYEGEIKNGGDTVRINSIGDVTISDYTRDADMAAPQALSDADQVLLIDQLKSFNFAVDDVDKAQMNVTVMDEAMRRAAYGLRDIIDQFLAGKYTEAASANAVGSTGTPKNVGTGASDANAYAQLIALKTALDVANIPSDGRFAVVPAWFEGLLLQDERFVSFGTEQNRAAAENGRIGKAAGFDIMMSNNVPVVTTTKYKIVAGHPMAWSFAQQILKVEAYRPQYRFADAVKGLNVYGAKVVRPNALAVLTATAA